MFPDLPTSLSGDYIIEGTVDEDGAANLVTGLGKPFGCWLDDTTPRLEHYAQLAVARYPPLKQHVLVCVPPGRPDHHYPAPIISVYEAYIYGMGCPPEDVLPLPKFDAYCVQKRWPGTHGKTPPTEGQFERLLALVTAHDPKFIFLF